MQSISCFNFLLMIDVVHHLTICLHFSIFHFFHSFISFFTIAFYHQGVMDIYSGLIINK